MLIKYIVIKMTKEKVYVVLDFGDNFRYTTKIRIHKRKKLDFIKSKKFCSAKGIAKRVKRQATEGEKIFSKHISCK